MSKGLEIIGAGFGRTGTTSLKSALETLGFTKCYHMEDARINPVHTQEWLEISKRGDGHTDWHQLFEGYRATLDWPGCRYWRQLKEAFPKAKVLLTERDPEAWYKSIMKTIYHAAQTNTNPEVTLYRKMVFANIWDGTFHGRLEDKDFVIDRFIQHNEAVKNEVPEEDLILFKVGDGWDKLCEKLSIPVPDIEYPHLNSTEWFEENHENAMIKMAEMAEK